MQKKTKSTVVVTRAEKKDATKQLIKELLADKTLRHNDLIDEASKVYIERFENGEAENVNDVKGRVGSVLDIMKKEQEVLFDGGVYALKVEGATVVEEKKGEAPAEKKPTKKRTAKKKTEEVKAETAEEKPVEEKTEAVEKPKKTTRKKKAESTSAPAPVEEKKEEKPVEETPKKRGRKAKTVAEPKMEEIAKAEEKTETVEKPVEEVKAEVSATSTALTKKEKAEIAPKNVVMDMSFLFGEVKNAKPIKTEEKSEEKPVEIKSEEKPTEKTEKVTSVKAEQPKEQQKEQPKVEKRPEPSQNRRRVRVEKAPIKPLTAEEKLKESFLKRIRSLGGDYFEYYSIYLLEKYSRRNGRRLEGLKISGGEHDGGIDGEIELTDKLGFRETIYIQAKNWNPEKGNENLWVVGETLLQQFIGACACRQAKDGKQHCRGIFITASRFTPEAKRILDDMSDKIVGYDGTDLFEAAKECEFGLIKRGNDWALDEKLLSGTKAFFNML